MNGDTTIEILEEKITETERQLLINLYDGEIRYLDDQLRIFFNGLKERNLLKASLVIITADHGDAFGEHGYFTHPRHLHESLLHVPLLVSPPGEPIGETVETPVSTLDIVPTILEYAGLSNDELPGTPLVTENGLLERGEDDFVYSSATGEDEHEGARRFAARGTRWKAILERDITSGKILNEQIFDLHEDPKEYEELLPSETERLPLRGLPSPARHRQAIW
ncbi:sulfatase-like hydrolase/transferase [Halostagnicola sp. A56]|uniref:sulfatase-like hydrolase/transferase n=1 Tax=Halostagnicola sp. A56 TaxID=1495067 RepID=UPI000679D0A8|nr:sulfatase-like hydrolase/transferase [Halostagnicola sp. A56]